jgi:hypothetical protein
MVTIGECLTCGEERCTSAHDCQSCFGEAEGKTCDRGHRACKDCRWQVTAGVAGCDSVDRCVACDDEDNEARDDSFDAYLDGHGEP